MLLSIESKYGINKEYFNNLLVVGMGLYSEKSSSKRGFYWFDLKRLDCGTTTVLI